MSSRPTNTLAIVSLVSGLVGWLALPVLGSLAAIVTGHMARRQLRDGNEQGDGLALAGLILGYSNLVLGCLAIAAVVLAYLGLFALVLSAGAAGPNGFQGL